MTTRIRLATTLLVMLLSVLPALAPTATAQDLDAATTALAITDLDGIEEAVSRTYTMDVADIVRRIDNGTESAAPLEGPILMLALVARFDTPANAEDALETITGRLEDAPEVSGIPVTIAEANGLGDGGIAFTGTRQGGTPVTLSGYVVHDETWLYLAMAVSEDDSSDEAARSVVQYGISRAPAAGEPAYNHTGNSSGGIWEKMPDAASNQALVTTQPIYDALLVPEPEPNTDD